MFFDTPRPLVSADRALSNRPLLSRWSMRSNVRMIWWDFFLHFVANRLLISYRDLSWLPGVLFSPKCPLWSEIGLLFVSVCFVTVRFWFFYFFSHIHSFQIHLENVCLSTVFSTLITELSFQSFIPKSHSLSRYPKVVSIQKLIFRYITLYRTRDIYSKSRK